MGLQLRAKIQAQARRAGWKASGWPAEDTRPGLLELLLDQTIRGFPDMRPARGRNQVAPSQPGSRFGGRDRVGCTGVATEESPGLQLEVVELEQCPRASRDEPTTGHDPRQAEGAERIGNR